MRGDRPNGVLRRSAPSRATPHARGSTAEARKILKIDAGYPACAGIDLHPASIDANGDRLPRMRGDRPYQKISMVLFSMATPHARGSTCHSLKSVLPHAGYPACAGIDRKRRKPTKRLWRLPRMRGDRPHIKVNITINCMETKHARGSTSLGP